MVNYDSLITGMVVGFFLQPCWNIIKKIFVEAWKNTGSACTGNCNQGRNCNCASK